MGGLSWDNLSPVRCPSGELREARSPRRSQLLKVETVTNPSQSPVGGPVPSPGEFFHDPQVGKDHSPQPRRGEILVGQGGALAEPWVSITFQRVSLSPHTG